jgi:membrane-bound lytic murein transglycosylase B
MYPNPYLQFMQETEAKYGLPRNLLMAIQYAETGHLPYDRAVSARSDAGALGLMQFMPATGARYGLRGTDFNDPQKAIDASGRYLRDIQSMGITDPRLMAAAYNAGEHNKAVRSGRIPQNGETPKYVKKFWGAYNSAPQSEGDTTVPDERPLQERHPNVWAILNKQAANSAMEQAQQTAQANNSSVGSGPAPRTNRTQQAQAPMPMPKPGGGSGGTPPGYGNFNAAKVGMAGLLGKEDYQDMSQAALPLLLQLMTLSKAMGSLNG